jgi:hypothetical protein
VTAPPSPTTPPPAIFHQSRMPLCSAFVIVHICASHVDSTHGKPCAGCVCGVPPLLILYLRWCYIGPHGLESAGWEQQRGGRCRHQRQPPHCDSDQPFQEQHIQPELTERVAAVQRGWGVAGSPGRRSGSGSGATSPMGVVFPAYTSPSPVPLLPLLGESESLGGASTRCGCGWEWSRCRGGHPCGV